MSSNPDCPFHAGSAIIDPRLFFGRQESLKVLRDRLMGVQPTSINIVGRRRTGKSSLLLHFVNTFRQRVSNPDRFAVAYLSLQNAACDTEAKFYGSIAKILSANIPSEQRQLQKMLGGKQWEQIKFNELIQAFKKQGILPVICIDNFEELSERQQQFPNSFYDNLRSLIDSNQLMLVIASYKMLDVYSKENRITSDFFNLFHYLDLNGGLTEEEAKQLVSLKNAAGEGLSDELQHKALQWGKKEPFLLQLAGETLWTMQRDRKSLNILLTSKNQRRQEKC
jgi:AAA+ ATPase superfamily predicted ATPase